MPILETVYDILYHNLSPAKALIRMGQTFN